MKGADHGTQVEGRAAACLREKVEKEEAEDEKEKEVAGRASEQRGSRSEGQLVG